MSVEDLERIQYDEGVVKNIIVDSLIERSRVGEVKWDFSHFDDSAYGQMAEVEYEGVTFVSNDWEDGVEFIIIIGEKKEGRKVVDNFKGRQAMRLREFLGELASEDPVAIQIRKELEEKYKRGREEGARKAAEKLEELIKIAKLLKSKE